jgi:hypothetical protein
LAGVGDDPRRLVTTRMHRGPRVGIALRNPERPSQVGGLQVPVEPAMDGANHHLPVWSVPDLGMAGYGQRSRF